MLYAKAGVPLVWWVDPETRTVTVHRLGQAPRMTGSTRLARSTVAMCPAWLSARSSADLCYLTSLWLGGTGRWSLHACRLRELSLPKLAGTLRKGWREARGEDLRLLQRSIAWLSSRSERFGCPPPATWQERAQVRCG